MSCRCSWECGADDEPRWGWEQTSGGSVTSRFRAVELQVQAPAQHTRTPPSPSPPPPAPARAPVDELNGTPGEYTHGSLGSRLWFGCAWTIHACSALSVNTSMPSWASQASAAHAAGVLRHFAQALGRPRREAQEWGEVVHNYTRLSLSLWSQSGDGHPNSGDQWFTDFDTRVGERSAPPGATWPHPLKHPLKC